MKNSSIPIVDSEDLFLTLCEGDNEQSSEWHFARWFVKEHIPELYYACINCQSSQSFHFVIEGISQHIIAIVRQIGLLAHFPNFNDATGVNRTVITIINDNVEEAVAFLQQEKYLANLYHYCHQASHQYLDTKIEVIPAKDYCASADCLIISSARVDELFDQFIEDKTLTRELDIRLAKKVNMVYNIGVEIDNLSIDDPHNVNKYSYALKVFSSTVDKEREQMAWNQLRITDKLSSLFSSDCFYMILFGMFQEQKDLLKNTESPSAMISVINELTLKRPKLISNYLHSNIADLTRREHARWNVEKLIMGFRPFTSVERYEIDKLYGREKKDYHKSKKKEFVHEDIVSNLDLRRYRPADVKYDVFLMLAIPIIIKSAL